MTRFERLMTMLGLFGAIATAIASLLVQLNKKPVTTTIYAHAPQKWSCEVENREVGFSMDCK